MASTIWMNEEKQIPIKKVRCYTPSVTRLQKLLNKGIMLGHQDDPVYGTTWKWDQGKSDVLLTTGD